MKILILNGPNLNLLGTREPSIYGSTGYNELITRLKDYGKDKGVTVECFQSNHEGALIDALHNAMGRYTGIVFNPGAYTHYSYSLRDAIASINVPVIEVHISNINKREEFRRHSVIAPVCEGQINGLGLAGYFFAIDYIIQTFAKEAQNA